MHSMEFNKINQIIWLVYQILHTIASFHPSAVAELVKHHYQPMNDKATPFPLNITLTIEQEENIYSF